MEDQDFAINGIAGGTAQVGLPLEAFEPHSGKARRVLLCARVVHVDAAYETLKARGVEFTVAPVDQYWGLRTAFFRDPDGNIWGIAQSIDSQQ